MLDALREIQDFTHGLSFDDFRNDTKTLRAVELDVIVLGEAVSAIPDSVIQEHPDIPWSEMRAMRHRLVHHYFSASPRIIWDTIQNDLPGLVEPLEQLLLDEPSD